MVEDWLVHRFVIIIGHHHPGARRQPSGMVSPVKKPGSPPPNGIVIRVGSFDEDIAHHAYRADRRGVQLQADEHLIAAVRKGDGLVHHDGLVLADLRADQLFI